MINRKVLIALSPEALNRVELVPEIGRMRLLHAKANLCLAALAYTRQVEELSQGIISTEGQRALVEAAIEFVAEQVHALGGEIVLTRAKEGEA